MFSEYTRNFSIYYDNLSTYYIICVFMSVLAISLSWFYHYKNYDDKKQLEAHEDETDVDAILSSYKPVGQQALEEMENYLTEDQRSEEKQAEREQLAAILELLKQQEEKFQVNSMEELEGQLKLYR